MLEEGAAPCREGEGDREPVGIAFVDSTSLFEEGGREEPTLELLMRI